MPILRKRYITSDRDYSDMTSKFEVGNDVWVKLDPHQKWIEAKVVQKLPNQSYIVQVADGNTYRRNEHNITIQRCRQDGAKSNAEAPSDVNNELTRHPYNLRQRSRQTP